MKIVVTPITESGSGCWIKITYRCRFAIYPEKQSTCKYYERMLKRKQCRWLFAYTGTCSSIEARNGLTKQIEG